MKYLLIVPLTAFAFSAFAQSTSLCQQKQQEIQRQIDYARQHGNTPRIAGLERAKAQAGNGCTDEKLKDYWSLAGEVLTSPVKMSSDSTIEIRTGNGASDWESFTAMWSEIASLFEHT